MGQRPNPIRPTPCHVRQGSEPILPCYPPILPRPLFPTAETSSAVYLLRPGHYKAPLVQLKAWEATRSLANPACWDSVALNQQEMSAYKAFKACVLIEWSDKLYITLVRGMPGTRELHRRTLEALHLCKCNHTVVRKNTPTVRGMLQQVKRLVAIETKEMYEARKLKEANH